MTYKEAIDYLYNSAPMFQNIGKGAYKPGLSTTYALDEHFNHPHKKFKSIHIGGTNGKGSCSHFIASIFQESGYKVGLYTSPHLLDFRERIRVNGEMISEEYVTSFIENERNFFEPLHPSFFEIATSLAFKYFADQHVDIAVIEVGLGGRLDCTNIITPELSIITNISKDHTNLLGNNKRSIAYEKAGIIKRKRPVVIGEYNTITHQVFDNIAKQLESPITYSEKQVQLKDYTLYPDGKLGIVMPWFKVLYSPLGGIYQLKNLSTVLCSMEILSKKYKISEKSIESGIKNVITNTGLQGRWQCVNKKPRVFCDTGHNIGCFEQIVLQLKSQKYKQLRIVIGMVNDKDINGVLSLLPKNAKYYFCEASVKRAMPHEEIKSLGANHDLHGDSFNSVSEAYCRALKDSSSDDFIFVGGSTFVVADLLRYLKDLT